MRPPAARLTLGVAAWIAFGAAAVFVFQTEQRLTARRNAVRAFDVLAREASASLASLRAAEQAYVAPGQGLGFWMSKADGLLESATTRVEELQQLAVSADGRKGLADAAAAIGDLRSIDKRARQYLNSDQGLMAADVIFSEGGEAGAGAGRQIEAARQSEYVAWDAEEGLIRRRQLYAAGGAAALAALAVAWLVLWPAGNVRTESPLAEAESTADVPGFPRDLDLRDAPAGDDRLTRPAGEPLPVSPELPRETVPVLKAAADLCGELNRVRDGEDLTRLLGRAAQVMDASGLVIWIGDPSASSLRPVFAHGYSPQALARMPHVPRTGDNAASAAYRTGALQIVLTRPGLSSGAIAAPMMSPNGCIGALTAEIKNGSETSDGIQALAAIFASQLATVLVDSVLEESDDVPASRIASA